MLLSMYTVKSNAVTLSFLMALVDARFSINNFTISVLVLQAATCNRVTLLFSIAFTYASFLINNSALFTLPLRAAK
jgi:hypothetical protein